MIRFVGVSKQFKSGHEGLKNINFHLLPQEMAFLTGHSGAGKSTVLNLITRMETPSRGSIIVDSTDLAKLSSRHIPYLRRKIGYISQDPQLLLDQTTYDNVALPLHIIGYPKADIPKRVRASLDKVGLLSYEKAICASLSTGEQQRVGIARAIVGRPKLLLADEPTGNLDPKLSLNIMALFKTFSQFGTSVLIATHDIGLIKNFSMRKLVLQQGRIISGEDQ